MQVDQQYFIPKLQHLEDLFSLDDLKDMVDAGYVSVDDHPTADLKLYNYTNSCSSDRVWNEVTINCRGLVTTGSGLVVARGFKKFFTVQEYGDFDEPGPFTVYEKLDGVLGILYPVLTNDQIQQLEAASESNEALAPLEGTVEWAITTRGRFNSPPSQHVNNQMLGLINPQLVPNTIGTTVLFECIDPAIPIVVDYGQESRMTLIGAIAHDGTDISEEYLTLNVDKSVAMGVLDQYNAVDLDKMIVDQIDSSVIEDGNFEGVVLRNGSGMFKYKLPQYIFRTNYINMIEYLDRTVWKQVNKHLVEGSDLQEAFALTESMLDSITMVEHNGTEVVEQFRQSVESLKKRIRTIYHDEVASAEGFKEMSRRDRVELIKSLGHDSFTTASLIAMLSDTPLRDGVVWKQLRPQTNLEKANNVRAE